MAGTGERTIVSRPSLRCPDPASPGVGTVRSFANIVALERAGDPSP
jgi:hypothetical protein